MVEEFHVDGCLIDRYQNPTPRRHSAPQYNIYQWQFNYSCIPEDRFGTGLGLGVGLVLGVGLGLGLGLGVGTAVQQRWEYLL